MVVISKRWAWFYPLKISVEIFWQNNLCAKFLKINPSFWSLPWSHIHKRTLYSQSLSNRISLAEHLVSHHIFLYQTSSSTITAMLNKGKPKILLYYKYNRDLFNVYALPEILESWTSTKNIVSNNLIHNETQTKTAAGRYAGMSLVTV